MKPRVRRDGSRALGWLCWLPLLCLLVVELYVRGFDGWGAWASAPLLLVPGLVSLAITVPALLDCAAGLRAGSLRPQTLLFAFVAALPMVWLGVRRFVLGGYAAP